MHPPAHTRGRLCETSHRRDGRLIDMSGDIPGNGGGLRFSTMSSFAPTGRQAVRTRRHCFVVAGRHVAEPMMPAQDLQAPIGQLLALLGCGEETACLAFDRLQTEHSARAAALQGIAEDERRHDAMLRGLSANLPPPSSSPPALIRMQALHVRLGGLPVALRCAGIAALDGAVCTMLSALLRPGGHLGGGPVGKVLRSIRDDEARHVAVTREIAMAGARRRAAQDVAARVRHDLASVLELVGADLDQCGVDPDRLLARLRRLPDGLLPS